MDRQKCSVSHTVKVAFAAGLLNSAILSFAFAAPDPNDVEAQARETWRRNVVRTAVPEEGCFHASYPNTTWSHMDCTQAPNIPYRPRHNSTTLTVGDGVDYVAKVSGLITTSIGSFPTVTGVTSESDGGLSNDYSLQLNSNFMSTAACKGISGCLAWEQFVYSSGSQAAFMQYWLIYYGRRCPSGWMSYEGSCYRNSAAVTVPQQEIAELGHLKLSGSAVKNGKDTLVFTTETEAYSTTGKDSVVDLATDWTESEFNIIGDGDGSEAVFNKGSSIEVSIAVTSGTTQAPTCVANAGTTGETNNLSLKACSTSGGSEPAAEFTESN